MSVSRDRDLDVSSARQATELLQSQRAAYEALLRELETADREIAVEPAGPRAIATNAERILRSLERQAPELSALAARLRRPGCAGPRAEAVRTLFAEVGGQAANARGRLDRLVGSLQVDQTRTLAEMRHLELGAAAAYPQRSGCVSILVDRTG